jgi:hypothetical protein
LRRNDDVLQASAITVHSEVMYHTIAAGHSPATVIAEMMMLLQCGMHACGDGA